MLAPHQSQQLSNGVHALHVAHWAATSGAAVRGPTFLCLHGISGSHVNYGALGPLLAGLGPTYAADLPGFGRSGLGHQRLTLTHHRQALREALQVLAPPEGAVLIGHSMGAYLMLKVAAEEQARVRALVLINPPVPGLRNVTTNADVTSVFTLLGLPWYGRRWLEARHQRLTGKELATEQLALVTSDPAALDWGLRELHEQAAEARERTAQFRRALLETAQSLTLELLREQRRFERLLDRLDAPTMLIHGGRDRLVPLRAAEALARRRPGWAFQRYPTLGHAPLIEAPGQVFTDIARFLRNSGVLAARTQ